MVIWDTFSFIKAFTSLFYFLYTLNNFLKHNLFMVSINQISAFILLQIHHQHIQTLYEESKLTKTDYILANKC